MTKDPAGPVELQGDTPEGCNVNLCRGFKFEDQNAASVNVVVPGGQITFNVVCSIVHGGAANVSLVDTTTGGDGTIIGSYLKTFDDFCPLSGVIPPERAFLVLCSCSCGIEASNRIHH